MRNHTARCLLLMALLPVISWDASGQRRRAPTPPPVPFACIDFYRDTHKDWLSAHPSSYGMTPISALGELKQGVLEQQLEILNWTMFHATTDAQRELGAFWAKGLDRANIEAEGLAPIQPLLDRIEAIRRPQEIAPMLTRLHFLGLGAGFVFHAGPDPDGSGQLMGTFSEAALGLPDPDYYLREDEDTRLLLAHYTLYVQEILRLTGTPEEELRAQMTEVINLETRLARLAGQTPAMPTSSTQDVPDETESVADEEETAMPPEPVRVPVTDLSRQYRNLQLQEFFARHKITPDSEVVITNPALLPGINRMIGTLKPGQWKIYLRFHLAHTLAKYLPSAFGDAHYALYEEFLGGNTAPRKPPLEVLAAVNQAAGPLLAREYVGRYVASETRHRATVIAANVLAALQQRLDDIAWISETAKTEARARLAALKIEIAAPEGLDDAPSLPDFSFGSLAHLMVEASRWQMTQEMARIDREDDTARHWEVLPQDLVLAYDPAHNRLIISAAVLNAPILDRRAPLAAQYGSYGALVGRELSRAIIPRTHTSEPPPGWSDPDLRAWETKLRQLGAQYSAFPWPNTPESQVNGERTAVENSADLAGVELAHAALLVAEPELDASVQDLFFRAWAGLWREQMGPETAQYNALTSPHPPGHWRSNGPLMNLPAFAEVYGCPQDTPMTRPEEDRIAIWR